MKLLSNDGTSALFRTWIAPSQPGTVIRMECRVKAVQETLDESNGFQASADEVRAIPGLGNLPLVVNSEYSDKYMKSISGVQNSFDAMQIDLTHLSSRGTRRIATGGDHQIPLERPDIVVDSTRQLVEMTR